MTPETPQHRKRIIDIIANSFDDNKSTNYTIKQDNKRKQRLRKLIEYVVFHGETFGKVFMSDDKNSACIILFPWLKKTTIKSLFWDIKLIFKAIGLSNLGAVLKREKLLKENHPNGSFYHLWFIGVDPKHHHRGIGSNLLKEVLTYCSDKPIFLETSVEENLGWYRKFGFEIINTLDLGYTLYVLRKI